MRASLMRWMISLLVPLCALAASGIPPGLAAEKNRHGIAVIIGNKDYGPKIPAVAFAHNDADAMKRFVIEVLGFREGNIIDLRDATKGQLENVFGNEQDRKGQLHDWVRPEASDVVVFYSGHGVPGLDDRRGYLLPSDGDANRAEIAGYPLDLLYANLRKLPAKSVTVFLDACFSGETPKGMLVRSLSAIVPVARPEVRQGLTVLAAAKGNQVASWDEDAKHGLFTHHLLLALRGKADGGDWGNGDGMVTLGEASAYLRDEMTYQARRRFSREQVPDVTGDTTRVLAVPPKGRPPGETFKDCADCPEMVVVPAGSFMMGSPESEEGRDNDEGPRHRVTIPASFAVGKFEVTRRQFARFIAASGHRVLSGCHVFDGAAWSMDSGKGWRDPGFAQGDDHPVVCVSWEDAQAYVRWLSGQTGQVYRLLTEAEWEYIARAGTRTYRYWGDDRTHSEVCRFANGADRSSSFEWRNMSCSDGVGAGTSSVGRFKANDFGLFDTIGNVWEWVEDCWNDSYAGAPADGRAWKSGNCSRRVVRGGSWDNNPRTLRAAYRSRGRAERRSNNIGFRVVRTL